MKYNSMIVRYDELGLKGKNRNVFEGKLLKKIRQSIKHNCGENIDYKIRIVRGRLIIESDNITEDVKYAVSQVIGASSFSPAVKVELDIDKIIETAKNLLKEELSKDKYEDREAVKFRVETTRANKRFPFNSMQVDRQVAEVVLPEFDCLKVNLTKAELTVGIDIREDVFVFVERIDCQRGLPVGTSRTLLSLLSGGIDSPVASYSMMRRGATVDFINFHSPPYIGEESKGKVVELAKILKKFQFCGRIYIVNFSEFQSEIKLNCEERMRTILYRRAMMKISSTLAKDKNYPALVTGEALGQVASQTIENMVSIDNASDVPIVRPLIGFEKKDVISLARKIGTYETSILPYPDSCTVFAPSRPTTKTKIDRCEREEARIDYDTLVANAIEQMEIIDF